MLRDGNLAVMFPRRTAVALLALCGLIAVGDGESGVFVCVTSLCVCIYLIGCWCVERECGQAVLCCAGRGTLVIMALCLGFANQLSVPRIISYSYINSAVFGIALHSQHIIDVCMYHFRGSSNHAARCPFLN